MNLSLLGKLIRLHHSEWADLLAAQAALLRAQLLVWTRPRGGLVTPVCETSGQEGAHVATGDVARRVRRLALAISRAGQHGVFRPNCLARAVALHGMLQRRGFAESSLHVGFRRDHEKFLAHAWVEFGGVVLADEEWHVKQFDELARLGMSQAT